MRSDGTTSVLYRISIDGKNTVITTGISCKPQQWNAKNAEASDARTNNHLKEFRKHAERLYDDMRPLQKHWVFFSPPWVGNFLSEPAGKVRYRIENRLEFALPPPPCGAFSPALQAFLSFF